jgi:hypothetical protein
MRYVVVKQIIEVIGYIWQPGVGLCAQRRELSPYDLNNIGDLRDRSAVERWIVRNFGDFQQVTDFRADFTTGPDNRDSIVHDWQDEESDVTYNDAMFPEDV